MDKHFSDRHRWQETRTPGAEWTPKLNYKFLRFEEPFVGIPTRVFEALLTSDFTKREGKVIAAICRVTYGYMKKKDLISYSQVVEIAGLDLRRVGEVMRNLREASVMTCQRNPYGGSILIWGIEEQVELWDIEKLKQLRKVSRARCKVSSRKRPADQNAGPRAKLALPPRAKIALGTEGQISPTPKILLKRSLKKNSAADAAVSLSQSLGREKRWLGDNRILPPLEEGSNAGIDIHRPSPDELAHVERLCAVLKKAELNPDVWVSHKAQAGVQVALVIQVLEQAVRQKQIIHNFWAWAEAALAGIGNGETIDAMEREHEKRKVEFAKGVDEILEQVALRATRKRDAGEVSK